MEPEFLKQIVEALIIANDEPISEHKISSLVEELTPGQVKKIVESLNLEYADNKRAFLIVQVAGGYQINTHKTVAPWIKKLYKGRIRTRLSHASLESLAIIVFQQPISRVEIDAIRGVNSGGVIKNLLERNLIRIAGRAKGPGKPLLYGTTKDLLEYLGVNDLSELPKPKEITEIMGKLDAEQGVPENILEALTAGDNEVEIEIAPEVEPAETAGKMMPVDAGSERDTVAKQMNTTTPSNDSAE